MLLASLEPKMQNFFRIYMEKTFILHSWKTNEEICVGWNNFRSEGVCDESGTMVWWTDENGINHSAMVKETPEEVNQIMQKSLIRQ